MYIIYTQTHKLKTTPGHFNHKFTLLFIKYTENYCERHRRDLKNSQGAESD